MPRHKKNQPCAAKPDGYDSYLDPATEDKDYVCDFEPTKADLKRCELNITEEKLENDCTELESQPIDQANDIAFFETVEQQYFHSIAHIPLLSADEEKNLMRAIELSKYAKKIKENTNVKNEHIEAHLDELIQEGNKARTEIIQHNLKLVVSIAKHVKTMYATSKIDLIDLVQEGNAGLIYAIGKYDKEKGTKFATYATFWIRLYCNIAITKQSRNIYLPTDIHNSIPKVRKTKDELIGKTGREPSIEEICKAARLSYQTVLMALRYEHDTVSYNSAPINTNAKSKQESNVTFLDTVTDGRNSTEEEVERILMAEDLQHAMKIYLSDKEQFILNAHYGLDGSTGATLEDIGKILGYTRARVSQIEITALKKLHNVENLQEYRDASTVQQTTKSITPSSLRRSFNIQKKERKNIRELLGQRMKSEAVTATAC